MVRGMTTRAVAIMRPMSKMVGALFSSNGVPSTATAGMCVRFEEWRISPSTHIDWGGHSFDNQSIG